MRKLLLALAALALAAVLGFSLGRRPSTPDAPAAWAQNFVRSPRASGRILIDGVEVEGVLAVGGLEDECQVIEHRVIDPRGGEVIRKIPGLFKVENITLTRNVHRGAGGARDDLFHDWFEKSIVGGQLESKDGSIVIFDTESGDEMLRYNFYEGWPCKWYVPELDSDSSGMAIEKIEIAIEKVERAK